MKKSNKITKKLQAIRTTINTTVNNAMSVLHTQRHLMRDIGSKMAEKQIDTFCKKAEKARLKAWKAKNAVELRAAAKMLPLVDDLDDTLNALDGLGAKCARMIEAAAKIIEKQHGAYVTLANRWDPSSDPEKLKVMAETVTKEQYGDEDSDDNSYDNASDASSEDDTDADDVVEAATSEEASPPSYDNMTDEDLEAATAPTA